MLQDVALTFKQDQALLEAAGDTKDAGLISTASRQVQKFSDDVEKLFAYPASFKSDYVALRTTLLAMRGSQAPIGGPCGGISGAPLPPTPRAGPGIIYGWVSLTPDRRSALSPLALESTFPEGRDATQDEEDHTQGNEDRGRPAQRDPQRDGDGSADEP